MQAAYRTVSGPVTLIVPAQAARVTMLTGAAFLPPLSR